MKDFKELFKLVTVAFLLFVGTISCSNDPLGLDEETFGTLTIENIGSEEDIEGLVFAGYDLLNDDAFFQPFLDINAMASEIATTRLTFDIGEIDRLQVSDQNVLVEDFWVASFEGIKRANTVVSVIDDVNFNNESKRNTLLAEARFLRAFHYFNLVRMFDAVPKFTELTVQSDEISQSRTPVDNIINEIIIPDLEFGIENLPDDNQDGRSDKFVAHMLLSKVHMRFGNYQEALTNVENVVNNSSFGLVEEWADLWQEDNTNKEIMFAIQFADVPGERLTLANGFAPANSVGLAPNGNASRFGEFPYLENYPEGPRKEALFLSEYLSTNGDTLTIDDPEWGAGFNQPFFKIFLNPKPGGTSQNIPIYRFADALLMYAEILNELNNGPTQSAYEAINKVRRRAAGENIDASSDVDLSGLTQGQFREAVFQERRWELPYEGHSYFDVTRRGFEKFQEIMVNSQTINPEVDLQSTDILMPIPASEIERNDNISFEEQNPGY